MNHEEVLNMMLADSCPDEQDDDGIVQVHTINLHCVEYRVGVRYLGEGRFEILHAQRVEEEHDHSEEENENTLMGYDRLEDRKN